MWNRVMFLHLAQVLSGLQSIRQRPSPVSLMLHEPPPPVRAMLGHRSAPQQRHTLPVLAQRAPRRPLQWSDSQGISTADSQSIAPLPIRMARQCRAMRFSLLHSGIMDPSGMRWSFHDCQSSSSQSHCSYSSSWPPRHCDSPVHCQPTAG